MALIGPAAEELFDPVPEQDLIKALNETLKLWNSQPDWAGDERNVVLTLSAFGTAQQLVKSRRRMSLPTGQWTSPAQHQSVLLEAEQAYLEQEEDRSVAQISWKIYSLHESEITKVLGNDV